MSQMSRILSKYLRQACSTLSYIVLRDVFYRPPRCNGMSFWELITTTWLTRVILYYIIT